MPSSRRRSPWRSWIQHVATSCFAIRRSPCGTCTVLVNAPEATDRHRVVAEWSARVLSLTGDAVRGQKVYATHCANCHRLHGQGFPGHFISPPSAAGPRNFSGGCSRSESCGRSNFHGWYVLVTASGQFFNGIRWAPNRPANSVTLAVPSARRRLILCVTLPRSPRPVCR